MRVELRRCNSIGDRRGIVRFARVVFSDKPLKRDAARQICSFDNNIRLDFNAAVAFFEECGLLSCEQTNLIKTTDAGLEFINKSDDELLHSLSLCCIRLVVKENYISKEFFKFDHQSERYFIQKYGFNILGAVFRNFLIHLNVLTELNNGSLQISEEYEDYFLKVKKNFRRQNTIEELKEKLLKQEEQGALAESFVVQFEQNRLSNSKLMHKVRQISEIDVSAGYDIVSFNDTSSREYDRYIEVKSYFGKPHFYWSKNEIGAANLYGERYYLYLVDMTQIKRDGYKPQIICNPIKNIFESEDWLLQPTSYLVMSIE